MWLIVTVVLAVLSLRGSRWAYVAYMLFAILFIPVRAGLQIRPLVCETPVSVSSALYSLQNWQHILLSALVASSVDTSNPAICGRVKSGH